MNSPRTSWNQASIPHWRELDGAITSFSLAGKIKTCSPFQKWLEHIIGNGQSCYGSIKGVRGPSLDPWNHQIPEILYLEAGLGQVMEIAHSGLYLSKGWKEAMLVSVAQDISLHYILS